MKFLYFISTVFLASVAYGQINSSSFAGKVDFSIVTSNPGPNGIVTQDFDGDGKVDIATTNQSGSTVSVFRNTSASPNINASTLASPVAYTTGSTPTAISAEDIDLDGKADIVVGNYGSSTMSVFKNNSTSGTLSFASKVDYAAGANAGPCAFADLDGDGLKDMIHANFGTNFFSVYKNQSVPGTIAFASTRLDFATSSAASATRELVATDLNNDGKPDVAVLYYNGYLGLFRNTSTLGNVSFATGVIVSGINLNAGLAVGDVDIDGKPDFVVSSYNTGVELVFKNTSTISALSCNAYVSLNIGSGRQPHMNMVSDLDEDGKPEIIVGNRGNNTVSVFKNFSVAGNILASSFVKTDFNTASVPLGLGLADIDGDLKNDLIVANNGAASISIFKNQIMPSYGLMAYYPFSGNPGDSSGYGNHGVVSSGVTLANDPFNNANKAYYFDGSSLAKITASASNSLNTTLMKELTFSLWIKPSASASTTPIRRLLNLQVGTTALSAVNFEINFNYQTNKLELVNFNMGSYAYTFNSNASISSNKWSHIVLTIDSLNSVKLYIDNVLDYATTAPVAKASGQSLTIGGHLTNGWNYLGLMDELRIYNRALSAAEISDLANIGRFNSYYSKSTGALNLLSTWGTNPDGSGTSPLSFDSSNCAYNVVNNNTTLNGNLLINGNNTRLVFGDGSNAFNFNIPAGNTIACDSMYVHSNITLTVNGVLDTRKLASSSSSTVQYTATSNMQPLAAGIYENMVVSGASKTLTGATTIRGTLAMLHSIQTNGYDFTLGTSVSNRGTLNRSSGTIIGKFTRWFAASVNSSSAGFFPVGTSTRYAPSQVEFTSAPAVGGTVSCEFIATPPGNIGLALFDFTVAPPIFIDKAAIDGFWRVTSSSVNGGTFTYTVTANNFTGVNNYSDLRMIRRATSGSWTLQGTAGTNTGTNTSAVVSRTGLTTLAGEYGLGGDLSQNPLPVVLLNLKAQLENDYVDVIWQTATERNTSKFLVQRSFNKNTWTTEGEVAALGNSSTLTNYHFTDRNIDKGNGTYYYRLVIIDANGAMEYSEIVMVSMDGTRSTDGGLRAVPNPAASLIEVEGMNGEGVLLDATGRKICAVKGNGKIDMSELKAGIYFLSTSTGAIKIVKQ